MQGRIILIIWILNFLNNVLFARLYHAGEGNINKKFKHTARKYVWVEVVIEILSFDLFLLHMLKFFFMRKSGQFSSFIT